jgi:hypothetical protein
MLSRRILLAAIGIGVVAMLVAGGSLALSGAFSDSEGDQPLRPCLAQRATEEAAGPLREDETTSKIADERLQEAERWAQTILNDPSILQGGERALVSFEKKMDLSEALGVVSDIAPGSRVTGASYGLVDSCKKRSSIGILVDEGEDPEKTIPAQLAAMLDAVREDEDEELTGDELSKDLALARQDIQDYQARLGGLVLELSTEDLLSLLEARHERGIAAVEVIGAHPTLPSAIPLGGD